jgi:hypothetical protein
MNTILEEAEKLVGGDRQQDYGDTQQSFNRIAKLWSAYKGVEITAQDVGFMMILLKVSRGASGTKRDTIVDIAGYARCLEMLGSTESKCNGNAPAQEQRTPFTKCESCGGFFAGSHTRCFRCRPEPQPMQPIVIQQETVRVGEAHHTPVVPVAPSNTFVNGLPCTTCGNVPRFCMCQK